MLTHSTVIKYLDGSKPKKVIIVTGKLLMLFYKRIKLIAGFSFFLLFGCGYSPLIDMNQTNSFMLDKGQFIIFSPKNDIDFHVRENLLADFGFPKNPKYRIELENKLVRKKSIVTEKNDITRYNLILNSHFKLKEIKTNKVVLLKSLILKHPFQHQ